MDKQEPGRFSIRHWFEADAQSVGLQIEECGTPLAHITFELPEFTDLMKGLNARRADFEEPVPMEAPDRTSRDTALVDPAWRITRSGPDDLVLLQLRHDHYGWLNFALPAAEAAAMAGYLAPPKADPAQ